MKQALPAAVAPVLVGYRATGKTTVAKQLASRFGWGSVDADDAFEEQQQETIAAFLAAHGEPAFRERETQLLRTLLRQSDAVLATGGGVVLRAENRDCLKQAMRPVIWLTAPVAEIRRRLAVDPATVHRRPALAGGDVLDEVATAVEMREPLYREVADVCFDTTSASLAEVIDTIAAWLVTRAEASQPGPSAGGTA